MSPPVHELLLDRAALGVRCDELRRLGSRIVFTNGCFDILHIGHVRYLRRAAELGDVLVLGVNSDESVRRLKGEGRPVVPAIERAEVLAELRSVDLVSIFEEDTPTALIETVRPDVLVKGGDYDRFAASGSRHIAGSDFVRSYGGDVRTVALVPDRSTTDIIASVLEAYGRRR